MPLSLPPALLSRPVVRVSSGSARRRPDAAAAASAARGPLIQSLGTVLLLLALLGLAGCGGSGRPCRYSDMDDQMMSTRTAFLERLAGCPIGGYN
jgi:hypothetical protein